MDKEKHTLCGIGVQGTVTVNSKKLTVGYAIQHINDAC
jgi:hypothetical protein